MQFGDPIFTTTAGTAANSTSASWVLREDEEPPEPGVLPALSETEARVLVPKRGKVIAEDGTCRVAIIRPCVSRGARILGLPPIYTPQMLEAHAAVFRSWPMYADHLREALAEMEDLLAPDLLEKLEEAKARRTRSIFELGGRVIESWWDPTIRLPEDDQYGFQPGAVVGSVIPQPAIARMIEADPMVMGCSINAYPTGAKPARVPWDAAKEGALIEGIVARPPGSVDWVVRAGAGGRVLAEDEDRRPLAVSLCEAVYGIGESEHTDETHGNPEMTDLDIKTASPAQIREWFLRERPADAPAIIESDAEQQDRRVDERVAALGLVTEDQLREALDAFREQMTEEFRDAISEGQVDVEAQVEALAEQRAAAAERATVAHRLIEGADNLTPGMRTDLKAKYVVLPSGPSPALLVEGDDEKTADERLRANVQADVDHAVALLREATADPSVTGQGGGGEPDPPAKPALPKVEESALLSMLAEGEADDVDPADLLANIGKGIR